jgi:hypothetical protein
MNSRRVHTFFNKNFPSIDFSKCDWVHAFRNGRANRELLARLLAALPATRFLVHVHRKLGNFLPAEGALDLIIENIGKSTIRITDRTFTRFIIVAQNGVATIWPPDSAYVEPSKTLTGKQ